MNGKEFNYVSAVKPAGCKDLYICFKEQCYSRPCPAINAIPEAYLNLSAKLNIFLDKKHTFRLSMYYLCVKNSI